jgi:predicted  nucleic acid-binding Zn-ribbon protein
MNEPPRTCLDCGRVYDDGESPPCPQCGCRTLAMAMAGHVTAQGSLAGRHKQPGFKGAIVQFVERTKVSGRGKLARESLRYDRTNPTMTIKMHRVEEQQPDGSWTGEHDERKVYPAKRKKWRQRRLAGSRSVARFSSHSRSTGRAKYVTSQILAGCDFGFAATLVADPQSLRELDFEITSAPSWIRPARTAP